LRAVAGFRGERPSAHAELMGALGAAASRAADALRAGRPEALIAELDAQRRLLSDLGSASGAPIVTPEVRALAEWALPRGAAVLPSGAGGGDIVLWVGVEPSPPPFRELAAALGHRHIPAALHAPGVCASARENGVQRGS